MENVMPVDAAADPSSQVQWHRLLGDVSQLFSVLDVLPVAAYVCDSDGLLTYFNSLAEQLWGRAPGLNDPRDRYCGAFKLFRDAETPLRPDQSCMAQTVRTGQEFHGEEVVFVRPDGTHVTAQVHSHPLHDAAGRISAAVFVLVAISASKPHDLELAAVNQQLVAQTAELQEVLRQKDEFLARLAHELRNPLAALSNSLQILALTKDLGRSLTDVRVIMQRQVQQMVRLVDDGLEVSRMLRGTFELNQASVALESVLKGVLQGVQPLIDAAGHRLTVSAPGEPIHLNGDSGRLTQAISNLLINAVRYSAPGSAIWLTGRLEGAEAVISVRDEGCGISAEILPQIFDLLAHPASAPRRSHGGLGVGLIITKRIVEMHGGTIEARSAGSGQGSEFIVRLPVSQPAFATATSTLTETALPDVTLLQRTVADATDSSTNSFSTNFAGSNVSGANIGSGATPPRTAVGPLFTPRAVVPAEIASTAPGKVSESESEPACRRILVVDDTRSAAYMLSKLLQTMGHLVQVADCAAAALEIAQRDPLDVIISDITMPDVDGYELARRLRQEPGLQRTTLIALTGYGEDEDRQRSADAGFNFHFVKPVSVEMLQELLKK
jgi:signal transduction histidine kinase